jgi:integrase
MAHPAFVIRWWEGSRRKKKSGFRTRTDAAEALARVRTGLGDGTLVEKRKAGIAFSTIAEDWLRLHSAPNLRSHADNQARYERHVKPFFGDAPLTAVTPTRILELRAKLKSTVVVRKHHRDADGKHRIIETKMAARTVNLVLALVRSILRFAVASGHIPASPTDRLGRGKLMLPIEKTKLAPPIEKAEDVGRLLAALRLVGEETHRPALFPLFATLVFTGVRRGEAFGLAWSDVDLSRRLISVRRSYGGLTKSGRHRTVPVPAELVTILQAWRDRTPWGTEGFVFPDDETGKMVSENATFPQTALWAALKRVGLRRIRLHDLRHQSVAAFLMAGGSIYDASKNLGHASVAFTAAVYGHLSGDHRVAESDRLSFKIPLEDAGKVIAFAAPQNREPARSAKIPCARGSSG